MMLQNHAWVLLPLLFKVEDRAMTFNVTEYKKVTDVVSDFISQLTS